MSAVLLDVAEPEFFAPVQGDAIDALIGEYDAARRHVDSVAAFMDGPEMQRAARYFLDANQARFNRGMPRVEELFRLDGAIKALDAAYWKRALDLTDVIDYMPDERRQDWFKQIRDHECPGFDEASVRDNLGRLMAQRMDFLSEMVDGVFRGLSGEHVTNRPEGFSKRMIIDRCFTEFGTAGMKQGLIQDLRSVVAKFMQRDHPSYNATGEAMRHFRRTTGEWHDMDGGAFRVRVYKKGTAHMEVHPDIAWRLNQILAHRYPHAIPPRHRERPKREAKHVPVFDRPLPFAVIRELAAGTFYESRTRVHGPNTFAFDHLPDKNKHALKEAGKVLEALGGVRQTVGYQFDYDAREVIGAVVASGMIPDQASYQFYPTPDGIAAEVIERAQIEPDHRCLEPSAGLGAIAQRMPASQTDCVELSDLHCQVLEKIGCTVLCTDFLSYRSGEYDRICMNPPFSVGRSTAHLEHAASMLAPGGRLVAVLPANLQGKDVLPGLQTSWSGVFENQFTGTSVRVVILTADRPS